MVTRTGFATALPRLHAHVGENDYQSFSSACAPSCSNPCLKSKTKKENPILADEVSFYGDPDGIRTRVTAVKGRCLRPLDHRAW